MTVVVDGGLIVGYFAKGNTQNLFHRHLACSMLLDGTYLADLTWTLAIQHNKHLIHIVQQHNTHKFTKHFLTSWTAKLKIILSLWLLYAIFKGFIHG